MSLASLQRALAEVLRGPRPMAGDAERTNLAAEIATGNDRLSPAMQLDVYREQFFLRHLDALRDDFSSLVHLLGADSFEALGKAYLQAFPPRSFTLRDLGRELAGFVASTSPWNEDPLLAELASVEWAFVEAFDAASAPALALADVAGVPEDAWPSSRIVLQPFVQRLSLAHAAHDYRLAVRNDEPPAARPEARTAYVIVFRGPAALHCLELDADAYALLDELARGAPLGEACERVAASSGADEAAFHDDVGAWFQQWTALGWISAIELAR
jgi:hypothetical protein